MEQTNDEMKLEQELSQLKQVARALKTAIIDSAPGTAPHIDMWCDHVLNYDGKNLNVPSVFTRLARLEKTGNGVVKSDISTSLKFNRCYYSEQARNFFEAGINVELMAQKCVVCGEFTTERLPTPSRSTPLCGKCHNTEIRSCSCCTHDTTFNDALIEHGVIPATYARVGQRERVTCKACLKDPRHFVKCDMCGEIKHRGMLAGYGHLTFDDITKRYFCYDCLNDDKVRLCNSCNLYYPTSLTSGHECLVCKMNRTAKKVQKPIMNYTYKPAPVFLSTSPIMSVPMGTEIEVDDGNGNGDIFEYLNEVKEVYLKFDGSLSSGFEIVTYPASLEYHRTFIPYARMFEKLTGAGYTAHDNDTCGLHVHIGKTAFGTSERSQSSAIARFVYLTEKFRDPLKVFSRRKDYHYCEFYGSNPEYFGVKEMFKRVKQYSSKSRHHSVNLQNKNTVEVRFFKGTLNKNTYLASLSLCEFMVLYAVKHKKDDEYKTLTWENFTSEIDEIKYPELKTYMTKKHLIKE
jgi:hypothetical protein